MAKSLDDALAIVRERLDLRTQSFGKATADEAAQAWYEIGIAAKIGEAAMSQGEDVNSAQSGNILWIAAKNVVPLRVEYDLEKHQYTIQTYRRRSPDLDPPAQKFFWKNT